MAALNLAMRRPLVELPGTVGGVSYGLKTGESEAMIALLCVGDRRKIPEGGLHHGAAARTRRLPLGPRTDL